MRSGVRRAWPPMAKAGEGEDVGYEWCWIEEVEHYHQLVDMKRSTYGGNGGFHMWSSQNFPVLEAGA